MTVKGKFLCTKNYNKKDKAGNATDEIVHQILLFDGSDAIKIRNVNGGSLKFGDPVEVDVKVYSGDYGISYVAVPS